MALEPMPISFIALLVLCVAYVVAYSRIGVTHPTSIFFLFVLLYLPLKYFFIRLGDFNYASPANEVGALSHSGAVEQAGLLLSMYLYLAAFMHQGFRLLRVSVPILSANSRMPMAWFSIGLGLIILSVFLLRESFDALLDGLKFREFTQLGGMGYVSILYELTVAVGLVQALDLRKYVLLGILILFHGGLGILAGRTAPILNIAILVLVYLIMVRRQVPIKQLAVVALVLPVFALLHGVARVRGDLLTALDYVRDVFDSTDDLFEFLGNSLISRIDTLEEFSVLSSAVLSGQMDPDPFWPAQLFVQYIPRSIWESKPFFFNAQMMSIFYPGVFEDRITFNFLGVGEFIYAFGLLGILPAAVLTGYLLHAVDRYVANSKSDSGIFLFFFLAPYTYLMFGFHVGWMNTPVIPTILINLLAIGLIGSFRVCRVRVG